MRIEYENKFSDLLIFSMIHQFLSPAVQLTFLAPCGYILWREIAEPSGYPPLLVMAVAYAGIWAIQLVFNILWLYSSKNHSLLTDHVIEVNGDALVEETKFNKTYFYWPGVIKAISRPGYIAIYVTPHLAHVVPDRAFSGKVGRATFLALVQQHIRGESPN